MEDFTAKVMGIKAKYPGATMLPTRKTREGEFAAQTTEFIKRTVRAKPPGCRGGSAAGRVLMRIIDCVQGTLNGGRKSGQDHRFHAADIMASIKSGEAASRRNYRPRLDL